MRCVEGWSMVIPWVGFPLAAVLKRVEPQGSAKYVGLRNAGAPGRDARPARPVPGAALALRRRPAPRRGHAPAHHPRGRPLRRDAAQPERRADPPRRAVEVRLQEHQVDRRASASPTRSRRSPGSAQNASEYGFYSNVNPQVDHPRWSQATERRIGEGGLLAQAAADAAVQRLRRAGREPLRAAWTSKPTTDMPPRRRCSACRAGCWAPIPIRRAIYIVGMMPAVWYFYLGITDQLGADPQNALERAARVVGAALPDPVAGHHAAAPPRRAQPDPLPPRASGCSPSTTRRCI